jgi:hypothetical protein
MAGVGTKITASDFNQIQGIVATVLGTGSGTLGYGQTVRSSNYIPSTGSPILAIGWQALYQDLISCRQHQTGNNESGNLPTVTNSTLVTEAIRLAYYNFANTVQSSALAVSATQQSSINFVSATRSTSWSNTTLTHTVTLSFANANYARYYFNTGGNVQFLATLTGYPGSGANAALDQDWDQQVFQKMGIISMNYNSTTQVAGSATYPTAGSTPSGTPASSIGFYQLTTSNQLIFTKTASSYSGNQYRIYARVDSAGSPTAITFTIQYVDPSAGPGGNIYESVLGTLTSTVQGNYASGSNVSVSSSNTQNLDYRPTVTSSGP